MKKIIYGTLEPDSWDIPGRGDLYWCTLENEQGEDQLYPISEELNGKKLKVTIEVIE